MNHGIPLHLIPAENQVLTENDVEKELNEHFGDCENWIYTEEPDDGKCPYCGNEYVDVTYASNVSDARTGVCPYDTTLCDYIVNFNHQYNHSKSGVRSTACYCSPEHEATLLTFPHDPGEYSLKQ